MARPSKNKKLISIYLPLAATAAALWVIFSHDHSLLAWDMAWPKLIKPLCRMFLYLGIGLAVGITVEGMGWAPMLARWVRPIMRFGKLKDESGAAFTTAFFSGTAANAMLMNFWREKKITLREMQLSYLVNTGLPVFLLHLPTTFFIIVPMTRSAGVIYLAINGIAALMRTCGLLLWTRHTLHKPSLHSPDAPLPSGETPKLRKQQEGSITTQKVYEAFKRRFTKIVTLTAPIYFLMYALQQAGIFDMMRDAAADWVVTGLLPVQAASVVVFAVAAEFTSGIAAAAALLDAGTLTTQQTVIALILGTIVATPIRALRHQLPSHAGIFTPRYGMVMLVYSQALRISSLLAVTALYLLLW